MKSAGIDMKKTLLAILLVFLWVLPLGAEVRYVMTDFKVSVREAPTDDAGRLGYISAGEKVELVKTEAGWAQIRLPNGKLGWLVAHYLVADPPFSQDTDGLRRSQMLLQEENKALELESTDLKKENAQLKKSKQNLVKQMEELQRNLEHKEGTNFLGGIILGALCAILGVLIGVIIARPRSSRYKKDLRIEL